MALPLPLSAKAGRETGRNGAARGQSHLTSPTHRRDEKDQQGDAKPSSRSFSLKAALPRLKAKIRSLNPLKRRASGPDGCSSPAGAYESMSPVTAEECSSPIDASLLRQKLREVQRSQARSGEDADDKRGQEVVSTEERSASSPRRLFPRIKRWCRTRQRGLPEDKRRRPYRASSSDEYIFYCEPGSRFWGC
ncbi:hypothetical protein J3F83DRAFT_763979 [Trichoderma novae-zelandiae]